MIESGKAENTCCVTGHRSITEDKTEYVKHELRNEISIAVMSGFTRYISGFAEAVDLFFAEIVAEMKKDNPNIILEAAIPNPERLNTPDPMFQRLIKQCDVVKVHSEKYYSGCYRVRNEYMVKQSHRVIAVYDGRMTGGTYITLRFARSYGRDIRIIKI